MTYKELLELLAKRNSEGGLRGNLYGGLHSFFSGQGYGGNRPTSNINPGGNVRQGQPFQTDNYDGFIRSDGTVTYDPKDPDIVEPNYKRYIEPWLSGDTPDLTSYLGQTQKPRLYNYGEYSDDAERRLRTELAYGYGTKVKPDYTNPLYADRISGISKPIGSYQIPVTRNPVTQSPYTKDDDAVQLNRLQEERAQKAQDFKKRSPYSF